MNSIPSVTPDIGEAIFGAGIIGFFYLIYMLVTMAISVGSYVLQSLGFYTIAKRRGIKNPWLSWLPVGNLWILGCISDQYQYVAKGKVKNKRKTLLILNILMYVAALAMLIIAVVMIGMGISESLQPNEALTDIGSKVSILIALPIAWIAVAGSAVAITVITYIALYDLYHSCDPANGVLYLLLSIFVSFTMPIFVFLCRNKELGMPPRKQEPTAFTPPEPVDVPLWRPVQNTEDPWEKNPEQ